MPGSRSSTDPEHKSPRESGEDSEDESEILEESPCGRWLKRREEVYVCLSRRDFLSYSIYLSYLLFCLYFLSVEFLLTQSFFVRLVCIEVNSFGLLRSE